MDISVSSFVRTGGRGESGGKGWKRVETGCLGRTDVTCRWKGVAEVDL